MDAERSPVLIGAVVQARMGSRRFPGKVLRPIAGKPMLQYLLERLQRCDLLDTIVVATSDDEADAPIADYCRSFGVNVHRGPLLNVAKRYKEASDAYGLSAFLRVSGDSPLLDQNIIGTGIELFRSSNVDVVTNVFPRTFPAGESIEIVRSTSFRSAFEAMTDTADLEHVTTFFYRNPARFSIVNFESGNSYRDFHFAVDTERDMSMVSTIISGMKRPHWEYSLPEIVNLYRNAAA